MTAVVVAYGPQPLLGECVGALLGSQDVEVDVVLVDNGGTDGAVDAFDAFDRVQVIRPGRNTGFAEGCNIAAQRASGQVLALVNPDVVVHPDALAALAGVATRPDVGIATSSLRLREDPTRMNSAGNPVHYLGLAWAGAHGEPATAHRREKTVASASGACCAITRLFWADLGGFEPAYFAYHEDVELSLRCWQRGRSVVYVPTAIATHHYEFSRNEVKRELLERNRWLTVLSVYSTRTLLLLAPPLLAVELLMLATSCKEGWLGAKLRGYRWLLGHRALIRAHRKVLQSQRTRVDRDVAKILSARFEPTNVGSIPGLGFLNVLLVAYWSVVRMLL